VHEARLIRDAEVAEPGVVKLATRNRSGHKVIDSALDREAKMLRVGPNLAAKTAAGHSLVHKQRAHHEQN